MFGSVYQFKSQVQTNPEQNFNSRHHFDSFKRDLDLNINDLDGVVWKKNKFLEQDSHRFSQEPLDALDVSLEGDFMVQHGAVLINSFNDYLRGAEKVIRAKISTQTAIGSQKEGFMDHLDAIDFFGQNSLLSTNQRKMLTQEVKYNRVIFHLASLIYSFFPGTFQKQLTVLLAQIHKRTSNFIREDIEDEDDIEKLVQSNVDDLVGQVYHDNRVQSLFFGVSQKLLMEFTDFMEKWMYTYIAMQLDYFTNKYYVRKRIESSKTRADFREPNLNSSFGIDLEEASGPRKRIKNRC